MKKVHGLSLLILLAVLSSFVPAAHAQGEACPGFIESRLAVGGLGRALNQKLDVVYEPAPASAQSRTQLLPAGGIFRVVHGPVCRADTAWWEIYYIGSDGEQNMGWIREGAGSVYAVEPLPKVDMTYITPDGSIMFQYPHDYQILTDTADLVMLSNKLTAEVEPGQLILAIYKSAQSVPSLRNVHGTPDDLMDAESRAAFADGVLYAEPVHVQLGGLSAVYSYSTGTPPSPDSLLIITDQGNGESSVLVGVTANGEVQDFVAPALAVAQSLVVPDTSDLAAALAQPFSLGDGSFSLNVRSDWLVEAVDRVVVIVNSEEVYAIPDLDSLMPGQILVFIFPTVTDIPGYDGSIEGNVNPASVLSYEISGGMMAGYTPDGAASEFVVGERPAGRWFAHGPAHDLLVFTIAPVFGEVVTIEAYAAPGELAHYEPTLLAMMETFSTK